MFPIGEIPAPEEVDWPAVHDVPLALVTGTNGKSTTVRLLAAMAGAAGLTPGCSSSDGVRVGDEFVLRGDHSGPEGARRVLRDPRVTAAVLGGLLRRGLSVDRADAAIVTNVTEDHLGEWGVGDLASLTRARLVIGRAIGPDGLLVLNADDPELAREGGNTGVPTAWFSMEPPAPGRPGAWLEGEVLTLPTGPVIGVDEIPAIIESELSRLQAPDEIVTRADSDLQAVEAALAWATPGDLLLLLVHSQRQAVLDLPRQRQAGE